MSFFDVSSFFYIFGVPYKGVPVSKFRYIFPNAFTSLNFMLGVFAICWATGSFDSFTSPGTDTIRMSAYFILLCVLFDKLDGFAARLVNASSEFGAQFDSLADLIAFGVAPAFCILYAYKGFAPEWFQSHFALLIVVFSIYVLCAAMRLAKYNALDSDTYHHHFSGVPSTFAGAINAITIVFFKSRGLFDGADSAALFLPVAILFVTGILMVSPVFLPKLQPRKNKIFNTFQAILIVITYISAFFFVTDTIPFLYEYLLLLVGGYLTIGLAVGLINRKKIIAEAKAEKEKAA